MGRLKFQSKYCSWNEVCTRFHFGALPIFPRPRRARMQAAALVRSCHVFIRSSHRGPLIKSTVLIRIEFRATRLGPSFIGGLNPIACNLSSISDCERWFRNQRFKIVRLMKTTAGLIWVLFLNQQSCPETLDKQRLSFCLGCGAERYVLSGDCAPRPPLVLRGRTHTERPCEERRGLGGHAEGGSRHAAGATHSDPSTHTQLSTTACCIIVVYKVIITIWTCIRVFWFLFISPEAGGGGDSLQTTVAPHKSIHKPVSEFFPIMTLIFCWWFN